MRFVGIGLGTLTLFAAACIGGVPLDDRARATGRRSSSPDFSTSRSSASAPAYAQVYGTTSRAIVIAYSMPIWAALLARIVLKERLNAVQARRACACAPPAWRS